MKLSLRCRGPMLWGSLLLMAVPGPAAAQYFGRNKVQYDDFDWRVLHSSHFDIHYYPEEEVVVRDAARMAERWYARLSQSLRHEFRLKPLIFYANHPDFQQTNVLTGFVDQSTGGVTESLRNRVIMPFTGLYAQNDHVLGHELVHVFQYSIAGGPESGGMGGLGRLPLWLIEGMAEYLSIGRIDPHTAMWLRDAALRGELPTINQLTTDRRFFPYRYGQALWAYIGGRWGDEAVPALYKAAVRQGWEPAVRRVLGISSSELSKDWITAIRAQYLPLVVGRTRPGESGRPVLEDEDRDHMNVGPVISPDGKYMAFFSSRELFGIDLFLADVSTGKILKKLASPSRTPHFEALSFINSAGAWSPDGRKFAFVVFEEGDNRIGILDVESREIERTLAPEDVGAISDPAWSPDGRQLAFAGIAGAVSDLFLYDLEENRVRRLTNDRYADLQPAWSPDGRTLAFVTDRGPTTSFEAFTFGPLQIGLMEVATGQVRTLDLFPQSKHLNPQFSPDGSSLYFISDTGGFSDIFRVSLAGGEIAQITRLATGVSGIAGESPAMSVATKSGDLLFSAFQRGQYTILALTPAETGGTPVTERPGRGDIAGVLPPASALGRGFVTTYLRDPQTGLASDSALEVTDYSPKLRLDYIGQPSLGVATGGFGTAIGGSAAFYFSDMLADQNLGVLVQAMGELKDIGGQVFYQNRKQRWNWAAVGGHIPYLTGFTFLQDTTVTLDNGSRVPARVVGQFRDRVFIDQAIGIVQYPFSMSQRIELNAGYTRYGFDREVARVFVVGNQVIAETREELPSQEALSYVQTSAALVGDNSFFGFTSPVMGWRYRFEVTPTFGTFTYQTLLADYRRYFFKMPFTFAVRGFHFGRYGSDADSLFYRSPLYLGYETLMRGYSSESFNLAECSRPSAQASAGCPEFDRLIGSRLGLGSIELRLPLFGVEGFGLLPMPFLPTELAAFVDGGMAWGRPEDRSRTFLGLAQVDSEPVFSAGVTARFNVLGFAVGEVYYAYPFQRPNKGWHFGFNLSPGW